MSITEDKEERPGYPRQEIRQAAHRSVTHEGEPMMSKSTAKATPRGEEICNILSDLAGVEIETVDELARFAYQVGVEPSDIFKTAETIAIIEAAVQGGGK